MIVCDRCKRGDVGLRKVSFTVARETSPAEPKQDSVVVSAEHLCQGCEDRTLRNLDELIKGRPVS